MDVRCDRCKTEYELDDARVTEAGVPVKCTHCGHVFKVKKKALVVTVPLKPDELSPHPEPLTSSTMGPAATAPAQALSPLPSAPDREKGKEWKVRQTNGNVFTCKELTTLQKWIVERKVSRDDEISLTGESWKRLGNIAELASFFQVVDEAQKGAQLSALQSSGLLSMPPAPSPPAPAAAVAVPVVPAPAPVVPAPAPVVPAPAPVVPEPMPMAPLRPPDPSVGTQARVAAAGTRKRGGAGTWIALGLLLAAGGGYGFYALSWQPRERAKQQAAATERLRQQERAAAQAQAEAGKAAEVKALTGSSARADAGMAAAPAEGGTTVAVLSADAGPAGSATPSDAGEAVASAPGEAGTVAGEASSPGGSPVPAPVKEVKHSFDWYMRQGDRLREREKAQAALDAYARATELEPDRAEPIAGRGLALLDMGSKLQAEAAFEQALRLNPRYGVALMGLAETYRAQGKTSEAIKYYEKYLEVLPDGSEASAARAAIKRLQE